MISTVGSGLPSSGLSTSIRLMVGATLLGCVILRPSLPYVANIGILTMTSCEEVAVPSTWICVVSESGGQGQIFQAQLGIILLRGQAESYLPARLFPCSRVISWCLVAMNSYLLHDANIPVWRSLEKLGIVRGSCRVAPTPRGLLRVSRKHPNTKQRSSSAEPTDIVPTSPIGICVSSLEVKPPKSEVEQLRQASQLTSSGEHAKIR